MRTRSAPVSAVSPPVSLSEPEQVAYAGIDTYLLRGRAPWTLHHHADHACTKKASECPPIDYPKPDGEITFDKPSSVYLAAAGFGWAFSVSYYGLPSAKYSGAYKDDEQRRRYC